MWVNLVKLGNQSICYKHLHIKAATNHNIKVWPLVYFLRVTSITYAERGRERERERASASAVCDRPDFLYFDHVSIGLPF